jgi:hypothetical protein
VTSAFLESTLLGACPAMRESWDVQRHSYGVGGAPDDGALFDAVRRHVVGLLVAGRVAEFARFTRTMERVLGEADPVLDDLLREHLLAPLAADVALAGIARAQIAPHLGPRVGLAWGERR